MGARWTPAQDRIVRTYPVAVAATKLSRSVRAIYQRRYLFQADSLRRRWTEAEDRIIARLPLAQAAACTKRTREAVRIRLVRLGMARDK
jgi:hypothetical protein